MPNLVPPVTTTEHALAYYERIQKMIPSDAPGGKKRPFEPLMTLYMTDKTSGEEIRKAAASGKVYAVKLYPAGATTNSDSGVTNIELVYAALEVMSEVGMPLLVHGEVTDSCIDVFDREATFIERVLKPLVTKFKKLKIVMEHITTKEAAEFVTNAPANIAATITPQHLLYNRNAIFQGGLRPHKFCLPVLKRETHRQALLAAVKGPQAFKFFLGTDSAPHAIERKESSCGCAGIYSAHAALELYAQAFEEMDALELFESFASKNGAAFYGLERNVGTTTLVQETWTVPETYPFDKTKLVPLKAGETLKWKFQQL
jgi:dihydroorotase